MLPATYPPFSTYCATPLQGFVTTVFTLTVIAAEVVTAPVLSVALAVIVYVPAVTLFQLTLYGVLVALPNDTEPLKYSTLLMLPSLSVAFAVKPIDAGAL